MHLMLKYISNKHSPKKISWKLQPIAPLSTLPQAQQLAGPQGHPRRGRVLQVTIVTLPVRPSPAVHLTDHQRYTAAFKIPRHNSTDTTTLQIIHQSSFRTGVAQTPAVSPPQPPPLQPMPPRSTNTTTSPYPNHTSIPIVTFQTAHHPSKAPHPHPQTPLHRHSTFMTAIPIGTIP